MAKAVSTQSSRSDLDGNASDSSEEWSDDRSYNRRVLEASVINFASTMWFADNLLVPAAYYEISVAFDIDPATLATLSLVRGVTEALTNLPTGFAADIYPRPWLIFWGCLIWGVGIIGCGLAQSFPVLLVARIINGLGLGMVQPLLYSLTSDTNAPSKRGFAFGVLQFTSNTGVMIGSWVCTTLAAVMILGMAGWRFVFIVFGALSVLAGVAVLYGVKEPRNVAYDGTVLQLIQEKVPIMCQMLGIPTFLCILGQGVFGMAPWFALTGFLNLWLELGCFSHSQTANIYLCFNLGQALAGLLGGALLDAVTKRFPNHGPPWLCMFSVGCGLPLFAFIFFGLRGEQYYGQWEFSVVFMVAGLLIAWCGIANNKMFADIVPGAVYSYIYGLDRAVEGAFGALGTPAVGLVTTKVMHYNQTKAAEAAELGTCAPEEADKLGSGMFYICLVAWGICFCFYCLLHVTYPRDRIRKTVFVQDCQLESDSEGEKIEEDS